MIRRTAIFSIFFLLFFFATSASQAYATTYYFWSNGDDASWTNADNWYYDNEFGLPSNPTGTVPGSTDDAVSLSGSVEPYLNLQNWGDINSIDVSATGIIVTGGTLYDNITGNAIFNDDVDVTYNSGTVIGNASFYGVSYNDGTVTGDATFYGDDSENMNTVNGTKIRHYLSNITLTRDFITGGPWTIVADGAVVNIYNAPHNGGTTLSAINGGSFIDTPILQTISTDAVASTTNTSVRFSGTISDYGGQNATQHGFAYGTSSSLTTGVSTTTLGAFSGTGNFLQTITGLTASTTYYVRAYSTNSAGTSTGSIISFSTRASTTATITTDPIIYTVTDSTVVIFSGTISDVGAGDSVQHGFIYSTDPSLTSGVSTTTLGAMTGTGTFTESISGLAANTRYYIRSYSTNVVGTSYGSTISFIFNPIVRLANVSSVSNPFSNAVGSENIVFTTGYSCSCFKVFDVTDKSNPVVVYSTSTPAVNPIATAFSNGYLYITTVSGKLITYNVTNPSLPVFTNMYSISSQYSFGKMNIQDGYLFISYGRSGGNPGGALIMSLANPGVPVLTSQINFSVNNTSAGDVLPLGNYLYVADYTGHALKVYDISNIASPVIRQNITGMTEPLDYHTFEPWGLASKDTSLYLFDDNIMQVYDISSSTNMIYQKTIITAKDTEGFNVSGNIAYFSASFDNALLFYDISDAPNPRLIATITNSQNNYWTVVDDAGYFYVNSTLDNRLNVYKTLRPIVTSSPASSITESQASLAGAITNLGIESVTDHGFLLSTDSSYASATSTISLGSADVESFSDIASGLTCATTYYFKAYATNLAGTAYGSSQVFTTSACPATQNSSTSGSYPGGRSTARRALILSATDTNAGAGANQSMVSNGQFIFTRSLTINSTGNDVRELQKYLNSKGFIVAISGPGSIGRETSVFGNLTKLALIKFQKANNIKPAAGFFGPITRAYVLRK